MTELEKLTDLLREIANRDDTITEEEQHLIDAVDDFVKRYELFIQKAEEDGVIDDYEKERISQMRKEILEGAWVTSMEDGTISKDESELISAVYEYMKGLKL